MPMLLFRACVVSVALGLHTETSGEPHVADIALDNDNECSSEHCALSVLQRSSTAESESAGCQDAVQGDDCWHAVTWAMRDGIHQHPDWYPGLSQSSSFSAFQSQVHKATPSKCSDPCARARPGATRAANQSGSQDRKGSFLVLGDWGWDPGAHGKNVKSLACQRAIADSMLAKMQELQDVKFVINVGDSFYPHGVKSKDDPQWETKWRRVYDAELRSVPWYSVYGNHDYIGDPCACSGREHCAQINSAIEDLDFFYMPDLNWFREHPELDLEVIGLDMNDLMWAYSNSTVGSEYQCAFDCQYTACKSSCEHRLRQRSEDGFRLFQHRMATSQAKNLLVFSHYPTDYFFSKPAFIAGLSDNSKHNITYFGGHRHNTDKITTMSTAPNTNWVVGGGGGWSCDGPEQGFVVGEIDKNGEISTYSVLVDENICCQPKSLRMMPSVNTNVRPWFNKCGSR